MSGSDNIQVYTSDIRLGQRLIGALLLAMGRPLYFRGPRWLVVEPDPDPTLLAQLIETGRAEVER